MEVSHGFQHGECTNLRNIIIDAEIPHITLYVVRVHQYTFVNASVEYIDKRLKLRTN